MSAKRKNQSDRQDQVLKVAKTAVVSTAPMSAIAARQAAMKSGLYKPEVEVEEEEVIIINSTSDELSDSEGVELKSYTGEEEDNDEDDHIITPLSGNTTPSVSMTPDQASPLMPSRSRKIPPLLDFNSVSRYVPTNDNTCTIEYDGRRYLFVGLKREEYITFMGQVLVAPLYGAISIAGAVISSKREIPSPSERRNDIDLSVAFYPVYSPRTHSVLSIHSESLDAPSILESSDISLDLSKELMEAVLDDFKNDLNKFESVIILRDLDSENSIEDLRNCVPCSTKNLIRFMKNELPSQQGKINDNNSNAIAAARLTNVFHGSTVKDIILDGFHAILKLPIPGIKAFKIESSWEIQANQSIQAAMEQERPPVSVICGAKDMGKSSFARYYINRLLSRYKRVAYIETDVGQSEFTPAGLLSLHYITQPILGPPYTHQHLEPERSFFFGSTSCRHDPDYYLACIFELVDHWKHDHEQYLKSGEDKQEGFTPLIVNTQGWISGEGYNLLVSQIQKIRPTDIFAMRHHMLSYRNLPPTFEMDILSQNSHAPVSTIHGYGKTPALRYLDCVLRDPNTTTTLADNFTATHLREMALGSYFQQTTMTNAVMSEWDFQEHIVHRVPWVVDWRRNLNEVWVLYEEVKHNELLYALNGSLVGLMGDMRDYQPLPGPTNNVSTEDDSFSPPNYCHTGDQPAPNPREKTCYGLAIVRAVDPARHAFLLVTPVPGNTLKKVTSIVKGEMQLPLWAMLDRRQEKGTGVANVVWKKVPYITQEHTEGAGANALRVRRNLLRKVQS
ncbi:hypothetical protein BDF20DRAFT_903008 [Mycotypha africana]|uniref:uncharacterized protein n=1 Tax=Mycotypha africana TaxID=64632 RepID=UPI00230005A5|nr:uncharacterized protein BDF20DRAFT_903008 [Mycotypha africana]KAI8967030.1 hypothetical protein BDF20DRAFT_903008 [Mycotypha africana]